MGEKSARPDARVAELAAAQHGVVTTGQLLGAGLGRHAVELRVRRGQLHRVHQGVYAVGHAGLSREGEWMAAVLAGGDGAVLSHASAVALWGLLRPVGGPVEISVPVVSGRRRRRGIRIHRVTTLAPSDLTRRSSIPVTTPSRTLLDLQRGSFDRFLLRRAVREAQHRKYKLDPRLGADRTRSDLERDFLALCRRHRIPRPQVNLPVGPFTVDSSGRSVASRSKPTATGTTRARSPSRTITPATWSCDAAASPSSATPAASSRRKRRWWWRRSHGTFVPMGRRIKGMLAAALATLALGGLTAEAGAASPADWMYEPTTFTEIRLTLPESQYELLEDANYDDYVEGFFSLAETNGTPDSVGPFSAPIKVGVKLKGSLGSRRNINEKAALKIKFDEFVEDQTFDGLEKMTLNNMVQDPSFIHETLAYKAFHDMGVYAPHTGFSYLWVNGKSYGLHLNIETQDKVALEKVFGPFQSPPQHLYEGEYQADVSSAGWHGTSEPRWQKLEVDEGKKSSKGDLETLLAAVEGSGGTFSERVAKYADLTEMTRMWLVEKYIEHWDGYSGSAVTDYQPNNYYLYSDAAGRFQIFPWGTDQTWETFSESGHDVQFGGPGGALFEDCKGDAACWSSFKAAGNEALTKLNALGLGTTARCTAAAVTPWREYENTAPEGKRPPQSVALTKEKQQTVREFIASRPAALAAFLGAPTPAKPTEEQACPPLRPIGGFPEPPQPPAPPAPQGVAPTAATTPATPPPTARLNLGKREALPGAIVLSLSASAPGTVRIEGVFGAGDSRATGCRGSAEATAAGPLQVRCRLTKALRRQLRDRATRVQLTATIVDDAGAAHSQRTSLRLAKH